MSDALPGAALAQEKPAPFEAASVRALARELAQKPYKPPDNRLPDVLKDLTYDRYRMIRFKPDQALWRSEGLPFQLQFFHRGFYYANRVDLFEVKDGQAFPIIYSPEMFTFGDQPAPDVKNLGFAGFRIHGPINRPDYFDEIGVFLGASYFRAVAKNLSYGLSARGLSLNTADLSDRDARAVIERTASETGLPTTDPVRYDITPLMDAVVEFDRERRYNCSIV